MSKKLTPLKELGFIKGYCLNSKSPYFDMLIKKFEIIETALKDYETLKKCLYIGNSGAIAITSYGFENYDLLKEILHELQKRN